MNHMARAVRDAYHQGVDDEMLGPIVRVDKSGRPCGRINRNDAVIFYNIRGEREIELTRSLTEGDFEAFPVRKDLDLSFVTMIEYRKDLSVDVAFPPAAGVDDTFGDVIARSGRRQVKITEAEKAVHVGYFLNGKREAPFPGEERVVVPTRSDVRLFDEAPEMSIDDITEAAIDAVEDDTIDVITVNLPNVDVVGHIENREAVIRAVEAVDRHAGIIVDKARERDMAVIVTADHGTVEKWMYPDGAVDTGHTDSPVPFVLMTGDENLVLHNTGSLIDIAPTALELLGVDKPAAMTGRSLLNEPVSSPCRRLLLLILDGWGYNEKTEGNLIAAAETPVMDRIVKDNPHAYIDASGTAVGLPAGTVGNSEAGHLHIGAGRIIYSDRMRINQAIDDGTFYQNEAFIGAMNAAREKGSILHLMGIVSFFSSHGSVDYLFALMEMAKRHGITDVSIHAMLGRRGEKPESGAIYIQKIADKCHELGVGTVQSVIGRYWSMDREENWDRIEKTYRMLVDGIGFPVTD